MCYNKDTIKQTEVHKMKTFEGLKAGARIRNNEDGVMEVFFGTSILLVKK